MDKAFLTERITKTKAIIIAYEDAILALTTGGVESYTLDTGQNVQKVTKINLSEMNKTLDGLYQRLCNFQTRLNGGGTITVAPAW